ncbi:MAG: glycosyltransferase [Patescibacteria group bacterium]
MKGFLAKYERFLKYATVGILSTIIDLGGIFIFVEYLSIPVITSSILSFFFAVTNGFLLNKIWTFGNTSKNYRKLFLKFLAVSSVGLGMTIGGMYILVHVFDIWYMFSKICVSITVLTWNFLANKFWTFRPENYPIFELFSHEYDLSVIIPAYNEEKRIKISLPIIAAYFKNKNLSVEIIVVNDGSKDDTKKVVEGFKKKIPNLSLINLQKNLGKGAAVKSGMEASKGKYILFTDADNSTPIEEFDKLFTSLKESDAQVAIGSRYLKDSNVKIRQPKYRILLGRAGNLLIRTILLRGISDSQCGFKLFESEAAKKIFVLQKVKRFGFDMESLVIAKSLGYKIIEVPVSWYNSTESRVRPIKDSLTTLKDLFFVKFNQLTGQYRREDSEK